MPKEKVEARGDWILFQQHQTKNKAGIILPDDSQMSTDMTKNIVVNVGEKVTRVKEGEEIIVIPRTALPVSYPERDFAPNLAMVKEEFVIAVIK